MKLVAILYEGLLGSVRKLGAVTLFLFDILLRTPAILARPKLITQQVYNSGVLSLVIIMT